MERKYLTVHECAAVLGRTESALRNLCMRRKIPFRKPGGRRMFLSTEIEEWVEQAEGLKLNEIKSDRNYN
jgi:excisionase family DNA binding protein